MDAETQVTVGIVCGGALLSIGMGALWVLTGRPVKGAAQQKALTELTGREKSNQWLPGDPITPDMPLTRRGMLEQLQADPAVWEDRLRAIDTYHKSQASLRR